MLRESIEIAGDSIDLEGLTDLECTRIDGIPHSEALLKFVDAFIGKDSTGLAEARETLAKEMSPEALVDVAGVAQRLQWGSRAGIRWFRSPESRFRRVKSSFLRFS